MVFLLHLLARSEAPFRAVNRKTTAVCNGFYSCRWVGCVFVCSVLRVWGKMQDV